MTNLNNPKNPADVRELSQVQRRLGNYAALGGTLGSER